MGRTAQHLGASSRRILFGTDEPLPEAVPLRAGPLAAELRAGALHDLTWGGLPTWHAVTFPYRDADWWTPPFAAEDVSHRERDGGFRAEVRGAFTTRPRLRTRFVAEADSAGRLRVEAEAVPDGDLPTNRTGLCLLLPTAAGGDRIEVEHDDGRITRATVPTLVPPWPPFTGIRGLRWRVARGLWAVAAFSGDSFEFEDQRNNADLSFKVYSRSNMMPRPYRLRAGAPVRQALELWVEGAPRRRPARTSVAVREAEPGTLLPRLGLAVGSGGPDAEMRGRAAALLRPSFLHATVEAADLAGAAPGLAALAAEAGASLHLDLGSGDRGLDEAALAALRTLWPEAVALFPSRPETVAAVRRALPGARIGGGTPHFFAQINRAEDIGPVDFLSFTVSPLVHGAADGDVMRSPETLPGLVATLRHRWSGLPVRLGPSAIAMRASPLGRMPPSDGRSRRAMAGHDPRARGLFAAAWALAMVARAAAAGIEALTLMAVDGPSGVAARRAEDGWVEWHPVCAVLVRLGRPAEIVPSPVESNPALAALAFRRDGARRMLLANLGADSVEAELRDWAVGASCEVLDEHAVIELSARDASPSFWPRPAAARVRLDPYAIADLREATP